MNDTLDEFEALLKKTPTPEPREEAKNASIFKAMAEFDKKSSESRQGMTLTNRLMDAVRTIHNAFMGAGFMKRAYIAAGIGFVTLALLNTTYLSELIPPQQGAAQKTAEAGAVVEHRKEHVIPEGAKGGEISISPGSLPVPTAQLSNGAPAPMTAPMLPPVSPALGAQAQTDAYAVKKEQAFDMTKSSNVVGMVGGISGDITSTPSSLAPPTTDLKAMQQEKSYAAAANQPASEAKAPMPAPLRASGNLMVAPGSLPVPAPVMQNEIMRSRMCCTYIPAPVFRQEESRDKFDHYVPNQAVQVREQPVSTFSINVDTSSYSFMRAALNNGEIPQADAIHTEALINYFPYEYEAPTSKDKPFKTTVSVFPAPWNPESKLIHIGIKGYEIPQAEKQHSNLVFLLDTSGSMNDPVRLPLVVNSMKLLLDSLKPDDTVSIVTYAGYSGVALPPTEVREKEKIVAVLNGLYAAGGTAGYDGLRTAYSLAEQNYDKNSVNRVILSTDGDFNVGITDKDTLTHYIEQERDKGIYLSVLGVGRGNYNNSLMQALAHSGNGIAAYVDNLNEARKVLLEETGSTIFTIARDVKIQVEFNPAKVAEYRLIGYEGGILKREDFNNDKVDAGAVGSGHAVTALYEITPVGAKSRHVDDLRYQKMPPAPAPVLSDQADSGEYAFVKIRYKLPEGKTSELISTPVGSDNEVKELSEAPQEARFSSAVAAFGQLLKGDADLGTYSYDDVIALARAARGIDTFGYRAEFINLVELAKHDAPTPPTPAIPPAPME